ncbi:hypothetical protein [Caballeronia mineralivorans]|nr:hypothetical protein [Caballeronia mineralivorans]
MHRTALELNPKIGVKKRVVELEKTASQQARLETAATKPVEDTPRSA